MQQELILWCGDKSDVVTCSIVDSEWKWVAPSIGGRPAAPRSFCSAVVYKSWVVFFGGLGLNDSNEIGDILVL